MDGNNPNNSNNPNIANNPNNRNNPNHHNSNNRNNPNNPGNNEVPQPPQLVLQQPPNRMNVDTDNQSQHSQHSQQSRGNQQNAQQQQQQFQLMQLQQQAAIQSPFQGLHTPPTFAQSQPMINPMAFSANPHGHYQQPQMVYSIPYHTSIGAAQTGQSPDLSSSGGIINAIADLMDQGLRESANVTNDIKDISVGTFIEQLQRLMVTRTQRRREVSKLADSLQFIIWKTVEELSQEEVDLCKNRNRNDSIPVEELLGISGDHTMVDRTELKEEPQLHAEQGNYTSTNLIYPKYIVSTSLYPSSQANRLANRDIDSKC